jgi:hypothetical protein
MKNLSKKRGHGDAPPGLPPLLEERGGFPPATCKRISEQRNKRISKEPLFIELCSFFQEFFLFLSAH